MDTILYSNKKLTDLALRICKHVHESGSGTYFATAFKPEHLEEGINHDLLRVENNAVFLTERGHAIMDRLNKHKKNKGLTLIKGGKVD